MTNLAANLADVLQERVSDLAAAGDSKTVESIVKEVKTEAERRTEVPDTFVYRATVVVLGVSVLTVVGSQLWLSLVDMDIPDGLIAIGSAAIGALAGLLAPTPASK